METTAISYSLLEEPPRDGLLAQIAGVHDVLFNPPTFLAGLQKKQRSKSAFTCITAHCDDQVIGYKVGHQKNSATYYSWVGGVLPDYRNMGVASTLMTMQHQWARAKGYASIETKTSNQYRNMLILNIKSGFAIADTYRNPAGELMIIFSKPLIQCPGPAAPDSPPQCGI